MATSFAELLKNRKAATEALTKKVDELAKPAYDNDPDARFWDIKHLKNEDGNGRAVIRFLPAPMGEDSPFVLYFGYGQQNKTTSRWYFHNSHQSFDSNAEDPAYEYNGKIYADNSIDKEDKSKFTIRRQKKYVSNILVIDDPVEPTNNGKVFLFEYGPMIFKLIQNRIKPDQSVDDSDPADPFDPIDGCNFKLKIVSTKMNGSLVPKYDTSTWAEPSPIFKDNDKIEAVWNKCYPLSEFIDPTNTKLYKPIKKQREDLAKWLGEDVEEAPTKAPTAPKAQEPKSFKEDVDDDIPFDVTPKKTSLVDDDEEDDFFAKFNN